MDDVETVALATSGRTRVAVVAPILARYDAISAAARDTWRMLDCAHGFDTSVLTYRCDYPDVRARVVGSVADLLLDPTFLSAELVIYHFGIYSELFNALLVREHRARQVVVFHNVTPPRLLPRQRAVLERSMRQIGNLRHADEVWAVSDVNAAVLREHGIDPARIHVIPLAVDGPPRRSLSGKSAAALEILFVGRFVPSKGALDLLAAVKLVRARVDYPFRVRLAGSTEWSDPEYLGEMREFIVATGLGGVVQFDGTVEDDARDRLFANAHILAIPSFHEGFCKPVVEALRAGCVPVGYDAYNLAPIANGLGRMVPAGDVVALAGALSDVMEAVRHGLNGPEVGTLALDRGTVSLRGFDRAAQEYVERFTFDRISSATLERARSTLGPAANWRHCRPAA